jgi:hypothetical protein
MIHERSMLCVALYCGVIGMLKGWLCNRGESSSERKVKPQRYFVQ